MANRSGLLGLARGMRAYLNALFPNSAPVVAVGYNAYFRQDNQAAGGAGRIVLVEGEFDGTPGPPKPRKGGTIDRNGEQNAVNVLPLQRALAWSHELVTCCVWAVDPNRPQDEEAQIEAYDALQELTVQALHLAVDPVTGQAAGFANIESFGDKTWTAPPGEAGYGKQALFPFTLLTPLFDQPIQVAYPSPVVQRVPAS